MLVRMMFLTLTYRSSGFVVVKVHLLAQIATSFAGVDKFSREFKAETNIVRAAAPFPVAHSGGTGRWRSGLWRPRLMTIITGARLNGAFAASSRHRMRNRCTCDGINKSSLTAS